MKLKTIIHEWGSMLQCVGIHDGPIVDIEETDVTSVESCSDRWVRDEYLNAYLYTRTTGTIAVRYIDLLNESPRLAAMAKESMINKNREQDPCMGSCT